jgi:hypothetical protein
VTAWIGAPPDVRQDGTLVHAVVSDLLRLLQPYHLQPIYTSEPRHYRLTPKGLAMLEEALLARRADMVIILTTTWIPSFSTIDDSVNAMISMRSSRFPDSSTSVGLSIRPVRAEAFGRIAAELTDFVTRWFAPLRAAAAFVSTSGYSPSDAGTRSWRQTGDTPMSTAVEYARYITLMQWFEITRYARGAFWGTGLGPDLCERIGGRDRVLAEAPAPIVRPLGDGAWLQLSPMLPADPEDLARLASFLQPILDWTQQDLNRLRTEWWARRRAEEEAGRAGASVKESAEAMLREAEVRGEGPIRGQRKAVAVRGIDNLGVDVTLNVSLALPPTPLQVALAELVVDQWYGDGFDGAFQGDYGEGGFHSLHGPSVDGAVLRWHADLGTADGLLAIRALARRLANIPTIAVRRLTLGTEEVG